MKRSKRKQIFFLLNESTSTVLTVTTAAFNHGRLSALVLFCPVCRNLKRNDGKLSQNSRQPKFSRVPSVDFKGKKLNHRPVNGKHAPKRIPQVKLKPALLDEIAKHPKRKSKMSAKNKRNILIPLLCQTFTKNGRMLLSIIFQCGIIVCLQFKHQKLAPRHK